MKSLKRVLLIAACVILLGASCGSQALDLEGTAWQLMSIDGETPLAGTTITLRFEGGQVKGSSGCNTYSGEYTIGDEGAFQVGPIAFTEMGCLDPAGVMDQEVNYLRTLQRANTIAQDKDELTIQGGGSTFLFWLISE